MGHKGERRCERDHCPPLTHSACSTCGRMQRRPRLEFMLSPNPCFCKIKEKFERRNSQIIWDFAWLMSLRFFLIKKKRLLSPKIDKFPKKPYRILFHEFFYLGKACKNSPVDGATKPSSLVLWKENQKQWGHFLIWLTENNHQDAVHLMSCTVLVQTTR